MGLALFQGQHCTSLCGLVDLLTLHRFVKVYQISVKFRTVYAGKFHFAAYSNTAGAAHAGSVDHDGVERDDGLHAKRLGGLGDELHHRDRADGEHFVILGAGLEQLLELDGNEAVLAVAAVVGHEVQMVAGGLELVFQNDDVLVGSR